MHELGNVPRRDRAAPIAMFGIPYTIYR